MQGREENSHTWTCLNLTCAQRKMHTEFKTHKSKQKRDSAYQYAAKRHLTQM